MVILMVSSVSAFYAVKKWYLIGVSHMECIFQRSSTFVNF